MCGLIELHRSLTGWQAIISDAVSTVSMSWSRQGYARSFGLMSAINSVTLSIRSSLDISQRDADT